MASNHWEVQSYMYTPRQKYIHVFFFNLATDMSTEHMLIHSSFYKPTCHCCSNQFEWPGADDRQVVRKLC